MGTFIGMILLIKAMVYTTFNRFGKYIFADLAGYLTSQSADPDAPWHYIYGYQVSGGAACPFVWKISLGLWFRRQSPLKIV